MKPHLMFADRQFDPDGKLPDHTPELVQDLELQTLWRAMSGDDDLLCELARAGTLQSLTDPDEIRYRHDVLDDCLRNAETVHELYQLALDALHAEREVFRSIFSDRPEQILTRSVRVLERLATYLRQLRDLCAARAATFNSAGFTTLFRIVGEELDEQYLAAVEAHLKELQFAYGMLVSARLGTANKGTGFVLRQPRPENRSLFNRGGLKKPTFSYTMPERDEAGWRALSDLRDRSVSAVANAAGQAADHVRDFFTALRNELGFYLGCVNLAGQLDGLGVPRCLPDPQPSTTPVLTGRELCDPCLAVRSGRPVVGSDVDAGARRLIVLTGANQGGKSTFLRSLGLAQLMTQCGMFVAARSYTVSTATALFTHYRREEDETMERGKLDEELRRMSQIADHIESGALLLCNESLAATNEREGSEIAREVVRAFLAGGVRIAYVTHLYDFAHSLYEHGEHALFLRAGRDDDGERSFRLAPGEPLPTSFGADLYAQIFGGPKAEPLGAGQRPSPA